jgi:hypothetical protein
LASTPAASTFQRWRGGRGPDRTSEVVMAASLRLSDDVENQKIFVKQFNETG